MPPVIAILGPVNKIVAVIPRAATTKPVNVLPWIRSSMLSDPLIAHRAEIGRVHTTRRAHLPNANDCDQRRAKAHDKQHMVSTAARSVRPTTIVTRGHEAVCAVM